MQTHAQCLLLLCCKISSRISTLFRCLHFASVRWCVHLGGLDFGCFVYTKFAHPNTLDSCSESIVCFWGVLKFRGAWSSKRFQDCSFCCWCLSVFIVCGCQVVSLLRGCCDCFVLRSTHCALATGGVVVHSYVRVVLHTWFVWCGVWPCLVLWLTSKMLNCLTRWESLIGVFPDTSSKKRRTRRCMPYKMVMCLISVFHPQNART